MSIREYRDGKGDYGEAAVAACVGQDKPKPLTRKLGQRTKKKP